MKFSVLIPVYNVEKYLEECIDSVLSQTYNDFEIILVDDGSTDSSGEMCDDYAEKYGEIIRVFHQKNSGQLLTRCKGITESRGDYCLFLDGDDTFIPEALEDIKHYAEKYCFPDIIQFPFYYDRGNSLEKSKCITEEDIFFNDDLKTVFEDFFSTTWLNSVCLKAVRREIAQAALDDFSAFRQLRCSEDRLHSMRMLDKASSVLYTVKPLYKYRVSNTSTTRQFELSAIERFNTSVLFEEELHYFRKWKVSENESGFIRSWADYPIYVMRRFYDNIGFRDKSKVVKYDWESFLPEGFVEKTIMPNHEISDNTKRLWLNIHSKKFLRVRLWLIKRGLYQIIKNIKTKFF